MRPSPPGRVRYLHVIAASDEKAMLMPLLRFHRRPATISWLLVVMVLLTPVADVLPYHLAPSSVAAATGTPCVTWGPSGGSYSSRLCLTQPLDGATVRGDVPVAATVTTVSGTSPDVE